MFTQILNLLRLQYRIGPFSVADTLGSLVIALIISPILSWLFSLVGVKVPRLAWVWLTIPVAELTHIIFHVDAPYKRMLLDTHGGYLAKLAFLVMLYMGLRGIRRIRK